MKRIARIIVALLIEELKDFLRKEMAELEERIVNRLK